MADIIGTIMLIAIGLALSPFAIAFAFHFVSHLLTICWTLILVTLAAPGWLARKLLTIVRRKRAPGVTQ